MKRRGLRASPLSAVAKADAGQNASRKHLAPNVLYTILAAAVYLLLNCSSFLSVPFFIDLNRLSILYFQQLKDNVEHYLIITKCRLMDLLYSMKAEQCKCENTLPLSI